MCVDNDIHVLKGKGKKSNLDWKVDNDIVNCTAFSLFFFFFFFLWKCFWAVLCLCHSCLPLSAFNHHHHHHYHQLALSFLMQCFNIFLCSYFTKWQTRDNSKDFRKGKRRRKYIALKKEAWSDETFRLERNLWGFKCSSPPLKYLRCSKLDMRGFRPFFIALKYILVE